ncbi:hypothetical protein DFH09DRAFT_1476501 [Mycena vulgaris]|nr:hypothetical protein DFH09DRAFT_1476501 [Mycena vulgaris]
MSATRTLARARPSTAADFHQFPPVATGATEPLYYPIDAINDSLESKLGRMIYEEFTTVVLLKDQMRVRNPVWVDFLQHLRVGNVQEHHLAMLRTLIVGKPGTSPAEGGSKTDDWNEASLVTPRHAIRTQWNEEAARKKSRALHPNLAAHLPKKSRRSKKNSMQVKDLPNEVEFGIGMKVMVTSNLETDLDLRNGARGEIVDIILDPDEPPVGNEPIVQLKKMHIYWSS